MKQSDEVRPVFPRIRWLAISLALAALGGAGQTRAADKTPAPEPMSRRFEVRPVRNLIYREIYKDENATKDKNKLDLYLPKGEHDFPVVFFVHGGAWRNGHKDYFGVYSTFGMSLARQGIGAVVPNYRLSPEVQHPDHIKDVAKAFAWTCKNIAKYGGRPDQIFVCGHSAGGHLVSLLATDDTYLKAEGLTLKAIRGAIPMSGVYSIPEVSDLFNSMFGRDAKVRREASPIVHARPDAPPFLIIYADYDLTFCGKACSEDFCKALKSKKSEAETMEVQQRNHVTLLLNACLRTDPVPQAILKFIGAHIEKPAKERTGN
jgi:acetyl esterase/lipase